MVLEFAGIDEEALHRGVVVGENLVNVGEGTDVFGSKPARRNADGKGARKRAMGDDAQVRDGSVEAFADVGVLVTQAADGGDFVEESGAGDCVRRLRVFFGTRRRM